MDSFWFYLIFILDNLKLGAKYQNSCFPKTDSGFDHILVKCSLEELKQFLSEPQQKY